MKIVAFSARGACVVVAAMDMILANGSVVRFTIGVVLLVVSILNVWDWIGDLEAWFALPDHDSNAEPPTPAVPTNAQFGRRSRDPAAIGLRCVKRHTSP